MNTVIPSEVELQRSPECFRGEARLSNPVVRPKAYSRGFFDFAPLHSPPLRMTISATQFLR